VYNFILSWKFSFASLFLLLIFKNSYNLLVLLSLRPRHFGISFALPTPAYAIPPRIKQQRSRSLSRIFVRTKKDPYDRGQGWLFWLCYWYYL